MSIIQVVISAAILTVLMTVFATMSTNQTRQITGLQQKLAAADFQQQLTRSFASGAMCNQLLATPGSQVSFDAPGGQLPASNPGNAPLSFTSIRMNTNVTSPILAAAGSPVEPNTSTLVVSPTNSFGLTNIVGSSNAVSGNFTATFEVRFDPNRLVQPLAPASTAIAFQTSRSGNTQTITSCTGAAATGVSCPSGQYMTGLNANGTAACTSVQWQFGGMFQTHYCIPSSCRKPNPLTGACSCPPGFSMMLVDDFAVQCYVDPPYDYLGMYEYACYK